MEIVCVCEGLHPASLAMLMSSLQRAAATVTFLVNGSEPTAAGRNIQLCVCRDDALTVLHKPFTRWDLRRAAVL